MADKIPVKAKFSGLDVVALQEFEPTDTIALALVSGFAAGVTTELGNNSITALGDVDTTGVAIGQVLTYSGSPAAWIPTTPSSGVTDHTLLTNIGTNTHAQIDTHISDATIHFTQASISITESQISDLQAYLLNITNEPINDLSDVDTTGVALGYVLTYAGSPPSWIAAPAGSSSSDELVKISANDTTAGYLDAKITAGNGITLTENNDGANEDLGVAADVYITTIDSNDIPVFVDSTRTNKILSSSLFPWQYSGNRLAALSWLQIDEAKDALNGHLALFDGTIVGLAAQFKDGQGRNIVLYINGTSQGNIVTLPNLTEANVIDTSLNIDITAGDKLQLRADNVVLANTGRGSILLYVRWRS